MLKDYISAYAAGGFRDYTEVRAQQNTSKRVVLLNGNMIANGASTTGGVNARIYKNGAYGFAANPEYSPESIAAVVAAAEDNAVFLDSKEKLGKQPFAPVASFTQPLNYSRDDTVSQKVLADFSAQVDAYITDKYKDLASRFVIANCLDMEKLLVTSDGVVSHSFIPRSTIFVSMTVMGDDGVPVEIAEPFAYYGLFDEVFTDPAKLYERIDKIYTKVRRKKEGVYADAGLKTCIIDSELAGMLAHEAVGHTVEADFVLSGSVGGPYLNKRVASELVTMVDFANTYDGKTLPVPVWVDDEGTPAKDAMLIENGILRGYMHNKESAQHFGVEPTGNARAFNFSDEPLIRMRNTAILPGKSKLEDMIASVEDGYYLVNTGNGQADATSEFMFGINFGYEIKNGKLGRAIKDTTISGVAFEMLQTVDMLSDEMVWNCAGMCGKKQSIPVSMGGPSIRCKVNIGGR
ncbi:MAG: TldD/PmbA family protein [Eubacteriales bacterium]